MVKSHKTRRRGGDRGTDGRETGKLEGGEDGVTRTEEQGMTQRMRKDEQ